MNNREYAKLVDEKAFPKEQQVPLDPPFEDARGVIQNLLLTPINSVAVIKSKAGSIRSNHYHLTDWHYIYVVSGSLKYYERGVEDTVKPAPRLFKSGDMFFTPPMKVHKVEFLEDTVIMTFAKNIRDHEHHEEDVVRMEF